MDSKDDLHDEETRTEGPYSCDKNGAIWTLHRKPFRNVTKSIQIITKFFTDEKNVKGRECRPTR
jgi:hypothetical protein